MSLLWKIDKKFPPITKDIGKVLSKDGRKACTTCAK
jgi:hypothetical protein